MLDHKINPKILLSTLWVFILFNMILRDLHEFPTEGYVEHIMLLKLSEEAMLFYAFIVETPILMILLSRLLKANANRWANTIAVIVSSLGILYTLPTGHLDEYFFATANAIAFFWILRTAWRLPTLEKIKLKTSGQQ